jgi:hypothetical protein
MSIFQATSFINIEVYGKIIGIPHYHFIAFLIVFRLLYDLAVKNILLKDMVELFRDKLYLVLLVFVAIACLGAFTLPFIFEGIGVYHPYGHIAQQVNNHTPLKWSVSNLGQAGYLFVTFVTVVYGVLLARKGSISTQSAIKAYEYSSILVIVISVLELYARLNGFYLFEFLFNNPNYGQVYFAGMPNRPRINGTFVEPSFLAVMMGSFLVYTISMFMKMGGKKYLLLIFLSSFTLFSTISTTAYACFALVLVALVFILFVRKEVKKVVAVILSVSLGFLIYASSFYVFKSELFSSSSDTSNIASIVNTNKHVHEFRASSGRLASDIRSIEIFAETYGLGVGIGSHRPSSFGGAILATTGAIGFSIALLFIILVSMRSFEFSLEYKDGIYLKAILFAFLMMVFLKSLAVSDLNSSSMWALIVVILIMLEKSKEKSENRNSS